MYSENSVKSVAVLNALDPVNHFGHPRVDAGRVPAGTSNAPGHNSHLDPDSTDLHEKGPTRVTLKKSLVSALEFVSICSTYTA